MRGIDLGEKIFLLGNFELQYICSKFWESYLPPAIRARVKGTVARGFFIELFLKALLDIRKNDFDEISIFAEIFVSEGCLALSVSPLRKF